MFTVHNLEMPDDEDEEDHRIARDFEDSLLGRTDHGVETDNVLEKYVAVVPGKKAPRKPVASTQDDNRMDEDDGDIVSNKQVSQRNVKQLRRQNRLASHDEDSENSEADATAEVVEYEAYPAGQGPYGAYSELQEMVEVNLEEVETDPLYQPWLQSRFKPVKPGMLKYVDEYSEPMNIIRKAQYNITIVIVMEISHRYGIQVQRTIRSIDTVC